MLRQILLVVFLFCGAGLSQRATAQPFALNNVITAWNEVTQQLVRQTSGINSQIASRYFALVHLSQYKALKSPLCTGFPSTEYLAAAAAHYVLSENFPGQQSGVLDPKLRGYAQAAGLSDTDIQTGQDIARTSYAIVLLALRSYDGTQRWANFKPEPANGQPGKYQFTPGQTFALYPQLGSARGFVIGNPANFDTVSGPNPVGSDAYNSELQDTQLKGDKTQTNQTYKDIASFWALSAGTGSPAGLAFNVSRIVAPSNWNVLQTAKYFAVQAVAGFDASIVTWYMKYKYMNWRPVTAITQDPVNPAPSWLPFINTPAHPEYPSAHSTTLGSHFAVISNFLGIDVTDNLPFSLTSESTPTPRSFSSLQAAGDEAGFARVYGGIHFLKATVDGFATALTVGEFVYNSFDWRF